MSELVCDFCNAPNPTWEYPAKTTDLLVVESFGTWCACEACKKMIDENDTVGLAARAYDRHPEIGYGVIKEIQSRFFTARTGAARPIKLTPLHGRFFER